MSPSFGRGAMTNSVNDLKNTDCALIMGSNAAENHPITFKWLNKAREERGAKIIHVDPRYTRTSAVSDIWAPLRSGTDIAFMGGIINYILENKLYHEDYVKYYTNAPVLVAEGYDFNDGLFSGYDAENRKYDQKLWDYQYGTDKLPIRDLTLQHPRCVFQLLKKHYSRYDIDTVCKVTGTPKDKYMEVIEAYAASGATNKTACILYAMGTTQHTVGSQNVRAFSVAQLLLGNMGRPGGGINALRGENNVQGASDMALLFQYLPGYIDSPTNAPAYKDLTAYIKKATPGAAKLPATTLDELLPILAAGIPNSGFKVNTSKWIISMLKAWWGDKAQKSNDYGYAYIPKRDDKKNYSHMAMFEAMYKGELEGLFIMGGNPVVGGPNANKEQEALTKLKWMVQADLWLNETAEFWTYKAWERPVENDKVPKLTPKDIQTEVFFMPACGVYEKEGSVANTGRWVQYRWKGADPIAESKPDLWMIYKLGEKLKELYASSKRIEDEAINYLVWGPYGEGEEPEPARIGFEMNGYTVADGKAIAGGFAKLANDGTTACGVWIYCGCWETDPTKLKPDFGGNVQNYKPMWRDNKDTSKTNLGLYSNWSWCWPVNRRIIYNRCSVQPDGVTPWPGDDDRVLIKWDATAVDAATGKVGLWGGKGYDVPDFIKDRAPSAPGGTDPYIMRPEGLGCLFAATSSMKDGPFPEHYEPWETPVDKNPFSSQMLNPVVKVWEQDPKKKGKKETYPYVLTTYRTVEHWQTGALTRNLPWLAELVPNMIVEIGEGLAREKGIKNGKKVIVSTTRGDIEAYALVTKRIKPLVVEGQEVNTVGALWAFGFKGFATGDPVNRLTPHIGDGNTMTPEYKACLCDIRRA